MSAIPLTVRHLSDPDAPEFAVPADRPTIYVVVDVAARTLFPYVPQHDRDYGPGKGVFFSEEDYLFVPPVLDFVFHLATAREVKNSRRIDDAAGIDAVLDEIAPDVARMLDNLATGPGGAPDWSVTSRKLAEELKHSLDRWPYKGTQYDHPYDPSPIGSAEDLFAARPELVRPEWADMDSEELDSAAKQVLLESMREQPDGRRPRTVGIRTWLYNYRDRQASGGMRPVDAAAWPGIVAHSIAVRDDSTDAELEQIAKAATTAAEAEGVRLLAVGKYTTKLRQSRRQEVRDQLQAEGKRIADLEAQLKPAKLRRRTLVTRVLSWDLASDTDTVIARDAAMSHTAVAAIRASLAADDDTEDAGR